MQTNCKAELVMSGLPGRQLHSRAGYCYGKMIQRFFVKNSIAHSTRPVYSHGPPVSFAKDIQSSLLVYYQRLSLLSPCLRLAKKFMSFRGDGPEQSLRYLHAMPATCRTDAWTSLPAVYTCMAYTHPHSHVFLQVCPSILSQLDALERPGLLCYIRIICILSYFMRLSDS